MSPPKKNTTKAKPKQSSKAPLRDKGGVPRAKPSKAKRSVAETKRSVKTAVDVGAKKTPTKGDRIAKVMARAGLCSRREAERWIEGGRVRINGKRLKSPAYDVARRDRIEVDGQPLPAREPVRLWRYFKPRGLVTTHRDPQERKTVFDALPDSLPRVISVGRLDYNTEGLLLLTNDGDLARYLELPTTGWLRRYRVRAHGRITDDQLKTLSEGITVEGVKYGPIEASRDSQQGANQWLTLGLREGKNREVRRVLGALGLEVNRLIRISYGPFQLLDLKPGQTDMVRRKALADQMGPKLAEEFQLSGDEEPTMPPRRGGKKRVPDRGLSDEAGPKKHGSGKRGAGKHVTDAGKARAGRTPARKTQRNKSNSDKIRTGNARPKMSLKRSPRKRRAK